MGLARVNDNFSIENPKTDTIWNIKKFLYMNINLVGGPVIQWISTNAKATDIRREYTKLYDP